jgi:CRP-like cAMP-binding protein
MHDTLRGLPILQGLSSAALQLLDQHARESVVPAGHFILREGDPGNHLFVIGRGCVRICKHGTGGEHELARLREGEAFGEMGILDRQGRSASAVAQTETQLAILPYVAFEILADHQPLDYARFLENVARELIRRLRQLDERFTTTT